jgi:hypothetical protein
MIRNAVIFGLGAMLLAACQPMPPQGPPPPGAPPPQAAATTPTDEPMDGKPLAPVDVRRLKCSTLTGASDDDKAYATSFLMGYRSALIHSRTIEIKRIEAVEQAALADCNGKPDAFASKVFAAALLRIGPGGELREPPHHAHRREPPSQAISSGVMTPDQPPPSPDRSSTAPIQYSPTQPTQPPAPPPAMPAQLTPPPPVSPPPAPVETPPPPTPAQVTAPLPREVQAPSAPPPPAPAEPAPPPAPPSPGQR